MRNHNRSTSTIRKSNKNESHNMVDHHLKKVFLLRNEKSEFFDKAHFGLKEDNERCMKVLRESDRIIHRHFVTYIRNGTFVV